jgi:cytochrome P450
MEERAGSAGGCPFHGDVAADFRPFDLADPFAFYERARREQPVFFSEELGFWVVTRHDDIRAIFKEPATFSSEITQAPYKERPPEVRRVLDEGEFTAYSGLSARQPPDHTRLRGFIKKAFTPRRVAVLEPQIREIAVRMIDAFDASGEPVDLVSALTYELPALVIFRLLGVPDEDVADVKRWAASRVVLTFGDQPLEEQLEHAHNLVAYWRYCLALVQSRFEEPQDDLPSDLVRIYQDGDESLTVDEMAGLVYSQLTAGHETTSSLLATGLKELLSQRDRWEELCADSSLAPAAVEEMLRIATPVFAWKRLVKQPARVGEVDLRPGDKLLLILGSANHDEAVFEEPEAIDLHRPNARNHLAFGLGIHFCLGAPLARLEAQVVLEELSARFPGMRIVEDQEFAFPPNTTFRAPHEVRVHLGVERAPLVIGFEEPSDVELVGGKAASLSTLLRAGFPVPPGFAVTTRAYREALSGPVAERISRELATLDPGDVGALDGCSARLRALVETTPMPAAVADAIRTAYRGLGDDVPVAVRSSATAEDSADASFAGQQDTYLWVVGEDAVVEHVRRCWASLFSARSIAYRAERGVAHDDVHMGVAVQRMVPARAAGVAMTLNPANGDRSKIAIEACFGLGETVVSGQVTPDSLLVDKVMLDVVDTRIACKEVELVVDVRGGCVTERVVEEERRMKPALTAAEARQVAELAKRAEQHYGAPQDVEWAVDEESTVVMLQSRPETVWSRAPRSVGAMSTGMTSLVQTLMNPLAARRASDVDADR